MSNDLLNALSGGDKSFFDAHHGGVVDSHFDPTSSGREHPAITIQPRPIGSFFKIPEQNQQKNFTPATTSPEMALQPPSMLPMILSVGLAMFFIYCNKKN